MQRVWVSSPRPSRYVVLAIIIAAHVLLIAAFRVELSGRLRPEAEPGESPPPLIVSFLEQVEPSEEVPAPSPALETPRGPSLAPPPAADLGSAITLPTPEESRPLPRIDFEMELKRSAEALIERAEDQKRQRDALNRPDTPEYIASAPKTPSVYKGRPAPPKVGGIALDKPKPRGDLFAGMAAAKEADTLNFGHSKSVEPVGHETRRRLIEVSHLLAEWRAEHGTYPKDLSEIVAHPPAHAVQAKARIDIVDTWNHKLVYHRPPRAPPCDYDLYSIGPNGVDDKGERDDIVTCGSTGDVTF